MNEKELEDCIRGAKQEIIGLRKKLTITAISYDVLKKEHNELLKKVEPLKRTIKTLEIVSIVLVLNILYFTLISNLIKGN